MKLDKIIENIRQMRLGLGNENYTRHRSSPFTHYQNYKNFEMSTLMIRLKVDKEVDLPDVQDWPGLSRNR